MEPDLDERNLVIGFEEDLFALVENQGLYRSRSIFRSREVEEIQPDAPENPDYVMTETEVSHSFLSAAFSTIQPLDEHRALLILTVTCHPATGRRFVNSTITWQFKPTSSSNPKITSSSPKVVVLAPQHSVGGWTEEQTKLIWGVSLPVEVGFMGSSIGVEPSREKETQKAVMHAMTIIGTVRGNRSRCVWTIEENKSSARGIPTHFQLAVVLDHNGPFVTELDVKAELGGGLWPTYMQAKKGQSGNGLRRTIDVNTWKCGDVEWEPGELGWKKFVSGITGEVSGVMLDFNQAIVRP